MICVVVLDNYGMIPRGEVRDKLKKNGRIQNVPFLRYLSFEEVKNIILETFSISGFQFLKSQKDNTLCVAPKQDLSGSEVIDLAGRGCLYLELLSSSPTQSTSGLPVSQTPLFASSPSSLPIPQAPLPISCPPSSSAPQTPQSPLSANGQPSSPFSQSQSPLPASHLPSLQTSSDSAPSHVDAVLARNLSSFVTNIFFFRYHFYQTGIPLMTMSLLILVLKKLLKLR